MMVKASSYTKIKRDASDPTQEGVQKETSENIKLELQKQLKSVKLSLPAGRRRAQVQSQNNS